MQADRKEMKIQEFPGYFGMTTQGVIAIHADWPMYPEEHGAELALLWLTAFPPGTVFKLLDDIDRCALMIGEVKYSNRADPFDERNLHVAIWHEDLLELQERGFITGVSPVSERRYEDLKRSELPQETLYTKLSDGTFKEFSLPSLDDYDNYDLCCPDFARSGVLVTVAGRFHIASILPEIFDDSDTLGQRIDKLLELEFYDTAVREACVGFEHFLKTWLASDKWGNTLVEEFMLRLQEKGDLSNTLFRILRSQIRTIFKFIRNDFMHNFIEIDSTQCRSMLFRIARVKSAVTHSLKINISK